MKPNSTLTLITPLFYHYFKNWFVLSILLLAGLIAGYDANAQSISLKEREALIYFYNQLNGDNWTNKTGWKTGGNFTANGTENTWFGVTLGIQGPNLVVKEINVPSNNLSGVLTDSLVNLPFLEILKLDGNQIAGELDALNSNVLLTELGLSNNNLNDTIPSWIGNLTLLEKLRLANNGLKSSIPTGIGNLVNLTQLRLEGNKLSGSLPTSFTSLAALTDLSLSNNALFATDFPTRNFVNGIQANWLNTQTLAPINVARQVISANKISLSWDEIDYTAQEGGYLILYGKTNGLYSDSLFIPEKDSVSVTLENLDNDSIYYFAIQSFTEVHADNKNIVYSSNSIQVLGRTLKSILPIEREALIALYNRTNGDNWTLKTNWKIGGEFLEPGFEQLWHGVSIMNINDTLRVRSITLTNNNLDGVIPEELGVLGKLFTLNLNDNNLRGTIPASLGNLKDLTRLQLANNRLSGGLAAALGGLTKVSILELNSNALVGEIPAEIVNISGASAFNINYNGLFTNNPAVNAGISAKPASIIWASTQTRYPLNITVSNIKPTTATVVWSPISYTSNGGNYFLLIGKQANVYTDTITMGNKGTNQFELTNLEAGTNYHFAIQSFTPEHLDNKNQIRSALSPNQAFSTPAILTTLERNALIAIFNSTGGNSWTTQTNWKTNPSTFNIVGTEGTWHGVKLELAGSSGFLTVTELDLSFNNLTGEIPPAVYELVNLKKLKLNGNRLTGAVSTNISTLSVLTELRLDQNALIGPLTNSFQILQNLNVLNLRFNGLYTSNDPLNTFITTLDADWKNTQTIAPSNFSSEELSPTSTKISWTPIQYTGNDGFYILKFGTVPGVYTETIPTSNKSISEITLNNLNPAGTYFMAMQTVTQPHQNNLNMITSENSAEFQFFALPPPPPQVILTAPANESRNLPLNLNLRWEGQLGIQDYQLQLSRNISFTDIVRDVAIPNAANFNIDGLTLNTRYFWRVRARNAGGFGNWSATWEFKTLLATPFAIAPSNPTCIGVQPVEFSWQAIDGANRYIFQVSTESNFTTLVQDRQNLQSTSITIADLPANGTYFWRVQAANSNGDESLWSPTSRISLFSEVSISGSTSFCTGVGSVTLTAPPGAVSYLWYRNGLPMSGASQRDFTTAQAGSYYVQVGSSIGCVFLTQPITVTTFSIATPTITFTGSPLIPAGETKVLTSSIAASYQWFRNGVEIQGANQRTYPVNQTGNYSVRATSDQTCSATSIITSITVIPLPPVPTKVVLVTPANESRNLGLNLNLIWEGQSAILDYQLQVSRNVNFTDIVRDEIVLNTTNYNFEGLTHNTRYFWRVRARNAGGLGEWSNTREFKTLLATPFTIAPSNPTCISVQPVEFSWQTIDGANRYIFQVSTESNFTTLVQDRQNVQTSNIVITDLPANGTYFWRVRAANSNGDESLWSPTSRISLFSEVSISGTTSFCAGVGSVTLTAPPGAVSYLWYRNGLPMSAASQREFTATQGGSYYAQVGSSIGCVFLTQPISVATNTIAIPTISFAGSSNICLGETKELTASIAASYQWFRNGVELQGATQRNYTVNETGSYSVRNTSDQGCIATSPSTSLTVNPLPIANISFTGSTNLCQGQNLLLNASTVSGGTYQWFNNNNPISGATAPVFTASLAGNYTVRVTNAQGCATISSAVALMVTPNPGNTITTSGPLSFCEGGNVTLTAPEADSYQWQLGNQNIDGATSRNLLVSQAGSYRAVATNNNLCAVTSTAVNVSVQPLPIAIITMNGPELSAPAGDFNYQWFKDGNAMSGETNRTFTTFTSGSYQVRLTAATSLGCSSLSEPQQLSITSFENGRVDPETLFTAFPNPVRDILTVRIRKTTELNEPNVKLFTMDGKELGTFATSSDDEFYIASINMSSYRSGQYLLLVRSKKTVLRKSIIKH